MLLVDDDEAEAGNGREDRRAGADHDRRGAGGDPLAFVTTLRVGQCRVEDGDAVAEARTEATDRLGSEGDLGNENDDAPPSPSASRAHGALGAPRRAAACGATSARARAGVEP